MVIARHHASKDRADVDVGVDAVVAGVSTTTTSSSASTTATAGTAHASAAAAAAGRHIVDGFFGVWTAGCIVRLNTDSFKRGIVFLNFGVGIIRIDRCDLRYEPFAQEVIDSRNPNRIGCDLQICL